MTLTWRLLAQLALAALVVSCSSSAAAPNDLVRGTDAQPNVGNRPIELLTWGGRSESPQDHTDPFTAIIHEHARRYPSDVVINAQVGSAARARATLRARLPRRDHPDTFQANIGTDLMQWVLYNGIDARESRVLPLDDVLPDVDELRQKFAPSIVSAVTYDGKLYGVPVNVQRLNTLFYNKRVLRENGLEPPRSVADFPRMAERLRKRGIPLLALGMREPWALALLIFECVLVAREGGQVYSDYFHGLLAPDDPRIVESLRIGLTLLDYANDDYAKVTWVEARTLVARGQAAMTIIGDWARSGIRGTPVEDEVGEVAFPGSESIFVFTADAFSLPREAKNLAGAKRLLGTLLSQEGQYAFNSAKGSIPPRNDVGVPDEPVVLQKRELLKRGPLVLALSGLVPPRFMQDLEAGLAEMVEQKDVEPVVHMLRSRYALLR